MTSISLQVAVGDSFLESDSFDPLRDSNDSKSCYPWVGSCERSKIFDERQGTSS
jgi:hypothetical protein